MTFSQMNLLNDEEHMCSPFTVYQTWRFDETFSFVVKPLLPYKVAFEFSS